MIVLKRNVKNNRGLIKQIINDTSEKYENFSHFIIKEHDRVKDWTTVVLYFTENESNIKSERIVVEHLEDVFYNYITEIAENAYVDFEGYSKINIIRHNDKRHMTDVFIEYRVPRETKKFNLAFIRKTSWQGSYRYEWGSNHYELFKYNGRDYLSYGIFEPECSDVIIQVGEGAEYAFISKVYDNDVEEYLFKLEVDLDNLGTIKVSKFERDGCNIFKKTTSLKESYEIIVEDIGLVVDDLMTDLENDLKIKISKTSIKYFKKNLFESFELKIKYYEKQ
ncbi:hypothetical protein QYB59_001546 [Clostridium perfringens]|nr:hypothetical protein [Clostridium perfringens]